MRILFIGGTGIISSACSALAVERGIDLHLLCRGQSPRPVPTAATVLHGDIRDPSSVRRALGDPLYTAMLNKGRSAVMMYDAVVIFVAFVPEHIRADLELFSGRTGQYVFISSASAYKKPVDHWPITEATPLVNPFWEYSRNKIACEQLLWQAFRESGFPATIERQ